MSGTSYRPSIVAAYYRECGLPTPEFEVLYIPGRWFRLDIAWTWYRVGIEVQGGIWTKGAHSTGTGIRRDMEKRNLGILAGWRVLECEPRDLCTAEMVESVRNLIGRLTV